MTRLQVAIYPLAFSQEDGPARLVSLAGSDGSTLTRPVRDDAEATARSLLRDSLADVAGAHPEVLPLSADDLCRMADGYLGMAGAEHVEGSTTLIYTSAVPGPLAEPSFDVTTGSALSWRVLSTRSGGRRRRDLPELRSGPDAIVLDHLRQAFEETDYALDFLPQFLALSQLRGLYDAVWGYEQDPSGFKRWALDRRGAFQDLLREEENIETIDEAFFEELGRSLPSHLAARAGAFSTGGSSKVSAPELRLPVGLAAAKTANRLHRHRGPEPTWFKKSDKWRPGPTWIENLYPPRPCWTRWEARQGGGLSVDP